MAESPGVQACFQPAFGEKHSSKYSKQSLSTCVSQASDVREEHTKVLMNYNNELKVTRNFETPWVYEYRMQRRFLQRQLKQYLAQRIKYMRDLNCNYGSMDNYEKIISCETKMS